MTDTTTNPDTGVADDQENDQVNDQAEAESTWTAEDAEDEDGEGSQDEEDEYEEVERGDKKYRVPKALKPELMMEADYRRKTQELAEQRKSLEKEVVSFKGAAKEIDEAKFELVSVQKRQADLEALTDADWQTLKALDHRDGTNRYDALLREFQLLPRKVEEIKTRLDSKEAEAVSKQQEILAKRVDEGQAILARDIPGWGPELGAKLVNFVKSEYGIDEQRHGEAFLDPALVKMAHAAFKAKEAERKTSAIKRVESTPKPVPVSRGGAAPAAGLSDKLSTAEWMKREREARERKAAPAFRQR
jgi:hypothetical protein